ncbi:hypothetical protein [Neptunicella sp. SCSIO 80796]|uniref:hypothetical protein n=1 Tax=Neptunicella plasticusilytica TaxID=3117012 RepID=UPI003A4E1D5C
MKVFGTVIIISVLVVGYSYSAKGVPQPVRYISNQTNDNDPQKSYFVELLRLALSASGEEYILQPIYLPMNQQRQVRFLDSGNMDLMWTMTTNERELQALPIRIPLLKGLLGYRIFVIRNNDQPRFANLKLKGELKKFKAVQGNGWPDVDVLEYNGFPVETTYWYDTIYKTLSAGHFDYFPRSVLEAHSELNYYHFDNLVIEPQHMLYYRTAIYYFVKKGNVRLAHDIEKGLRTLISDGRFDKFLFEFPEHQAALEAANMPERIIYQLDNPYLPKLTPNDPELWYVPEQR